MHWTTFRKIQEELRHAIVFQFSEIIGKKSSSILLNS